MGASPSATQAIGRHVVCDVTDLTCCGGDWTPYCLELASNPSRTRRRHRGR